MAIVRTAGGFLAGFFVAAAVALLVFGAGRGAARTVDPRSGEHLATVVYLLLATSLPAAVVFAAVTCVSKRWRELKARTGFAIAASCGSLFDLALMTGVAAVPAVVVPFPFGGIGAAARLIVPAALLGLLALGAARAASGRRGPIIEG